MKLLFCNSISFFPLSFLSFCRSLCALSPSLLSNCAASFLSHYTLSFSLCNLGIESVLCQSFFHSCTVNRLFFFLSLSFYFCVFLFELLSLSSCHLFWLYVSISLSLSLSLCVCSSYYSFIPIRNCHLKQDEKSVPRRDQHERTCLTTSTTTTTTATAAAATTTAAATTKEAVTTTILEREKRRNLDCPSHNLIIVANAFLRKQSCRYWRWVAVWPDS